MDGTKRVSCRNVCRLDPHLMLTLGALLAQKRTVMQRDSQFGFWGCTGVVPTFTQWPTRHLCLCS